MYSTKSNSITVNVHLYQWHQKTNLEVLIDCGTTDNFIDQRTVESLHIGTRLLPEPRLVRNVDGTPNKAGHITRFANLTVRRGDKTVTLGFYVANLGRDRLILGLPWLKVFNPTIDWSRLALIGDDIHIKTAGYGRRKPKLNINTIRV